MPKSNTIDKLDKHLDTIQTEVMYLIASVTPVSEELWDAIHECKWLITELKSGQIE